MKYKIEFDRNAIMIVYGEIIIVTKYLKLIHIIIDVITRQNMKINKISV